jgi:hypothetical protein
MIQLFTARLGHYLFIFFMVILGACSEKKTFSTFDADSWKGDKLACKGTRRQIAGDFEKIRRELLGMSQEEVIDLLGRPDYQLLLERTQKAFVYYIEPGAQCQSQDKTASKARIVSFRFNAMNRATEVLYGEGKPR